MTRLTGPERKRAVVESACRIFAKGSYRGRPRLRSPARPASPSPCSTVISPRSASSTSPASTPSAAGHALWEKAIADEPAPENWIKAIGKAYLEARAAARIVLVDLWIQALTEAADHPEIRRALRRQVREVHEYVAAVIRRAQEAGGSSPSATRTPRPGSSSRSAC